MTATLDRDSQLASDPALDPMVMDMLAARDRIETVIQLTADVDYPLHVLLYGPPGTGKSTIPMLNALANQPTEAVQCSDKRSGQSLLEMVWIDQGSMHVKLGPASRAWQSGGVLILEEIDRMSADMADVLHSVLVRGHGARVSLLDGTLIQPHDRFRAFATMNGSPDDLPEAIQSRFIAYKVDCPSTPMLKALPKDLRRVCARVYAAVKDSRVPLLYSYREFMHYGQLRGLIGDEMAALGACMGDKERAERLVNLVAYAAAPNGSSQP